VVVLAVVLVGRSTPKSTHQTTTVATAPTPQAKAAAASKAPATTKLQVELPCPPPPGEGQMGVCTPKPVQVFGSSVGAKVVPATVDPPVSIPDVSSWQGRVNWSAIKQWQVSHHFTPAGIFKMGEYAVDPYAATNNSALRSLGMWRAGYWFVRNTGCSSEASQIKNEAKALGLRVVVLDIEVPEARGYAACLVPSIKAAGFIVVIYTAPGTWPDGGGSAPYAWMAAYGSSLPGSPFGGAIKAWQCTDGVFGCVLSIPGLSRGDMSVNYGITSLGVAPAPVVNKYALYPKTVFTFGTVKASEQGQAKAWDGFKCLNPVERAVCKSVRSKLVLLAGRDYYVATHKLTSHGWVVVKPPRWGYPNKSQPLGSRFAGLERRLNQK
jgi:hypothetical protein